MLSSNEKNEPTPQNQFVAPKKELQKVGNNAIGSLNTGNVSIRKTIESKKEELHEEQSYASIEEENAFTFDQVKMAWTNFAYQMRERKETSFFSTLTKRNPKLILDTLIEFEIDNVLQEGKFELFRQEMLDFLRKSLRNKKVNIQVKLLENSENEVKFVSNQEKFKKLAQINPHLETLRRMFHLDIEL